MQHYRNLIAFLCLSAVASSPVGGLFALSPASANFSIGKCPATTLCVDAGQAIDGAPDCSGWDNVPPVLSTSSVLPVLRRPLPVHTNGYTAPEFTAPLRLYLLHHAMLFYHS